MTFDRSSTSRADRGSIARTGDPESRRRRSGDGSVSETVQRDPVDVIEAYVERVSRWRDRASFASVQIRKSRLIRAILVRLLRLSYTYFTTDAPIIFYRPAKSWTPRQPRLVIVTNDLSASGAPRIVGELVRIFFDAGWFVTIVSTIDGPARESIRLGAALVVDPSALDVGSPILNVLSPVTELAVTNTVVTANAVIAMAHRTPVFWYLHEVSRLEQLLRGDPLITKALAAARRVFSGSELSASLVRSLRPDVRVLPYGLDRLPASDEAANPGSYATVHVAVFGAIERRKGQDLAVAALLSLPESSRKDVRLTLYGRILDQAFAEALDCDIRKAPQIEWGGELSADAYAAAMCQTDVVLVSSRDDTLPLVSLDALGAGRVLICTSTTGTSTWIEDGTSGFVASAPDAVALAAALTRALRRRPHWPMIARAGRSVFEANFSQSAFATAFMAEVDATRDE